MLSWGDEVVLGEGDVTGAAVLRGVGEEEEDVVVEDAGESTKERRVREVD